MSETWQATNELRWRILHHVGGPRILQQRWICIEDRPDGWGQQSDEEWRDVPLFPDFDTRHLQTKG